MGLTLACALAAQKVEVRVVDRAARPATTSRANILHARGVEVLARLDALGDLPERSLAPLGMTMHVGDRPLATVRFAPLRGQSTQALFVSQADVEEQLRRRLGALGVEVEWNRPLDGLEVHEHGVTAHLDGTRLHADWVVGCDGAHSTVRDLAAIDFPGVSVGERFLLADVHVDWDRSRDVSAGWFHRDGILMAMPMPSPGQTRRETGTLWRLMAEVTAAPGEPHLTQQQILDRFEQLVPHRSGQHARLGEAVWTSVFRIHRRLAADYRRGRVLLAGDAAHVHSPIGGQGMNTGIGDAENLAWKLALVVHGRADARLLDTYTAERRPLATWILNATTANTRILLGETLPARLLRDRIMLPLLNLPAMQRAATRSASQLDVTYRNGPLGARRGRSPHPGDRIGNLACLRADATPTRLHAELGSRWALLAPQATGTVEELATTARAHLGDDVGVLRPQDATQHRDVLLVRPDGHLSWRGRTPADLRRWLTETLGCTEKSR